MTPAAYALVDLSAVAYNLQQVRHYAPDAKVMAVIKANAYGHGLLRIAGSLKDVDAVAVARVDEGVRLRQSGFVHKIVVLEGFVCELELNCLVKYNLDFVVHSEGQVEVIENYKGRQSFTVWIKIDTGMNRLGFKAKEFSSIYSRLNSCQGVGDAVYLMTHLSSADETDSQVTLTQMAVFDEAVMDLAVEKSIANSAAIIAWPDSIRDWVRPGIMIYGVSPFVKQCGMDFGLKSVMSLHSRLIAIKLIDAGELVGYAGSWKAKKTTRLGVVAIGYGDGYPRYAETGTPVLVNGEKVSLVGRVSMDMITVDLAEVDAKPGDPVVLWGNGLPVEEIAKYSNTIPYALLCGITQRVKISYIESVNQE